MDPELDPKPEAGADQRRTLAPQHCIVNLKKSQGVMRVSVAERGGFSMMSRSGGLKDRAVAGRPAHTHT